MPIRPGQRINPNPQKAGRVNAERLSMKQILNIVGDEIDPRTKRRNREKLARKLWKDANAGKKYAVDTILHYTEGKPVETAHVEHGASDLLKELIRMAGRGTFIGREDEILQLERTHDGEVYGITDSPK